MNCRTRLVLASTALISAASPSAAQDFHYTSSRDSGPSELNYEIYRYQAGVQTRLTFTGVVEQHPVVGPTLGMICFSSLSPSGMHEIVSLDPGTGALAQITFDGDAPGHSGNGHPFFAPDGDSLFITTHVEGGSVIRRIDLSGSELAVVVDDGGEAGHSPAAVTPVGPKLFFSSDADGDFELYRCELDGSNREALTSNLVYDAGAVPAPDGQRVAFTREDPADPCATQLWVMDHDGSNQAPVTAAGSPGGKWPFGWNGAQILYVSSEGGDSAIFSIGSDGAGKTLLVDSAGADQHLLPDATCGVNVEEPELSDSPDPSAPGQIVAFDVDTGGESYLSYEWTFGDGGTAATTVPSVSHVYSAPGAYPLTVTCVSVCSPSGDAIADGLHTVGSNLPLFPGTGDDLVVEIGVNGPALPLSPDVQVAFPGDVLSFFFASPGHTFAFDPVLLGASIYPHGFGPSQFLPGLFLNPGTVIWLTPPQLALPLPPMGTLLPPIAIPPVPQLAGLDLMFQALVVDPQAQNGYFGTSNGKVVEIK